MKNKALGRYYYLYHFRALYIVIRTLLISITPLGITYLVRYYLSLRLIPEISAFEAESACIYICSHSVLLDKLRGKKLAC